MQQNEQSAGMPAAPLVSLTGNQLKLFACFSMLVDHVALNFFRYSELYQPMRFFGRIAFPLYLFLLAEGAAHTGNKIRYLLRLICFAVISEIPFDLGTRGMPFVPHHENVMWTLSLALICILALQELAAKGNQGPWLLWTPGICLLCVFAAEWIHTDYGAVGVIAGILIYLLRQSAIAGMTVAVVALCLSSWWEFTAIAAVPLAALYNGKRGGGGKTGKYLFYAFYPVHFLVIWYLYRTTF